MRMPVLRVSCVRVGALPFVKPRTFHKVLFDVLSWHVQDTLSGWVWPYFVLLIVLGPWLAINLFLVVISNQYDENMERLRREQERA